MTVTNKQGMVLDLAESYQLVPGDSQDLCGPWSVSSLRLAGLPGLGPQGKASDVQNWTFQEVDRYMPNGHVKWLGSSIDDMHIFLTDSLDPISKKRNLHWFDISPITIENIKIAVKAGYPVLITVNEQNVKEKKTGKRPAYPWNLNVNHIFPVMGIDKDGDFICADELNNKFQGYWPPIYVSSILQPSWASIVQVIGPNEQKPWLAPIPNGNPLSWEKNFNAQRFAMSQPTQENKYQLQQRRDEWNSTISFFLVPINLDVDQVAKEWFNKYQPKYNFGPPLSRYPSVDWNGVKIIVTQFLNGQCQNTNGKLRWWYQNKEVTF